MSMGVMLMIEDAIIVGATGPGVDVSEKTMIIAMKYTSSLLLYSIIFTW